MVASAARGFRKWWLLQNGHSAMVTGRISANNIAANDIHTHGGFCRCACSLLSVSVCIIMSLLSLYQSLLCNFFKET